MSDLGLRKVLGRASDTFRGELWPLPSVGVALAVLAGIVCPRLDARLDSGLPDWLSGYLFTGGPEAARTVLDAVAGSLITVTSLTFSLTVVTLQLASSQFSPRLLRTFTRDRFVQVTLGLFLATFVYALTVLRTVRTAQDAQDAFVPEISVTLAFFLAVASVTSLVLFLGHLARQIRVETMLRTVHADARDALGAAVTDRGERLGERPNPGPARDRLPRPPAHARQVVATESGFLVRVEEDALYRAAGQAGAVVLITCHPGVFAIEGTPIGWLWAQPDTSIDAPARERLAERIGQFILVGPERTSAQDSGFGLRQLTDVAIKALSPGINDPTTAIHALGHISALLCELAATDPGPVVLTDEDGAPRVVLMRPRLGDLLEQALTQPRRYGAGDPQVLSRLAWLLRELAWNTSAPAHHAVIAAQLHRLRATIAAQDFDEHEQAHLGAVVQGARQALVGVWNAPT